MIRSLRSSLAFGLFALALGLSGCGGGGGGTGGETGANPFAGTRCGQYASNASDNGDLTVTIGEDGTFNGTIRSRAGFSDGTVQGTITRAGRFDGSVTEDGTNQSYEYTGTLRFNAAGALGGQLGPKNNSDLPTVTFSLSGCQG